MKLLILILVFASSISNALALTVKDDKITLEKLEDYNKCHLKNYPASYCQDALYDWVESHTKDAFSAAKMTRKRMFSRAAVPLFHKAIDSSEFDCEDSDLALAIKNTYEATSGKKMIKQAADIIFGQCAETNLAEIVVDNLSPQMEDFQIACRPFKKKGLLKGLKKKACK